MKRKGPDIFTAIKIENRLNKERSLSSYFESVSFFTYFD